MKSRSRSSRSWSRVIHRLYQSRLTTCLLMFIAMAIITTLFNIYLASSVGQSQHRAPTESTSAKSDSHSPTQASKKPILWTYHDTNRPLGHVITVFGRIGYVQGGPPASGWDVLWSHQYPFTALAPETWRNLKPHHKINHFPGTGCFTSKPKLATLPYSFIPKAFQLPGQAEEFKKEATAHPDFLWVQKSSKHRGIKIKDVASINVQSPNTFVQQFITNPLLIDGKKFDIGVYTVITSADPLRAYAYQEEILLRFCSKDYHPFSTKDPKKYVVDDNYLHPAQIPSLAEMVTKHKFSNKQALNAVLKSKGYSPDHMWEQVNSSIQEVLVHCEQSILKYTAAVHINDTKHFFELVRFDFVIDDNLRVWLMEVNLSPNLSSDHFPENRFMYEQVLFNLLSLVGLARASNEGMRYNGLYESIMLVNDHDIQVPFDECSNGQCDDCIDEKTVCRLCKPCRTEKETFELKRAFLEHVSRRNFRRLLPDSKHRDQLSSRNDVMRTWFIGKCQLDASWCV